MSSNSEGMIIRMRHIKANLLLRRGGKQEISFIDFYNSLSKTVLKDIKLKAKAVFYLRKAVFLFKNGKIFVGFKSLLFSFYTNPSYFIKKIMSNSGLIRKKMKKVSLLTQQIFQFLNLKAEYAVLRNYEGFAIT